MTNTTVYDLSNYSSRSLLIEVVGMNYAAGARTSNHRIKVPYSSLAQTMQNIRQMGGKVANVTLLSQDILGESKLLDNSSNVENLIVEDVVSEARLDSNLKTIPSSPEPMISAKVKTTAKTTSKSLGSSRRSTSTRRKTQK